MGLEKQAKTLTKHQQQAVLNYLTSTRQPERNRVIFLLSIRAGLRAKEIAQITWSMVCDAQGQIADSIRLENSASKGRSGGVIWMNDELRKALIVLKTLKPDIQQTQRIIRSERCQDVSAQVIVNMFRGWYTKLGYTGCSSHSGRRTFITNAAKKISSVGGSIRDVQSLARHSSLSMTQRYIECDVDAQKKVVQLIS